MYYKTYSTFKGCAMYMEDLYVSPEYRRHGIASEIVSRIAKVFSVLYDHLFGLQTAECIIFHLVTVKGLQS